MFPISGRNQCVEDCRKTTDVRGIYTVRLLLVRKFCVELMKLTNQETNLIAASTVRNTKLQTLRLDNYFGLITVQ